jgi:uncharacterized protein
MSAVGGRKLCLLALAALAAACACSRSSSTQPARLEQPSVHEVPVQVTNVGFDEDTGAHYVMLENKDETRDLPIMIGPNEAYAIELALNNIQPPRPLTHDLLKSVIQQTGNRVDRVVISDMRDEVYYAKIFLDHGRVSVDSRPSDAIALATEVHAPIYVSDNLFETAPAIGAASVGKLPDTARALGITVQQVTPEIAQYFGMARPHGVLVAEVDPVAANCGIERGDIITKVGSRDVQQLGDFNADIASIARSSPLMLTIRRGATTRTVSLDDQVGR